MPTDTHGNLSRLIAVVFVEEKPCDIQFPEPGHHDTRRPGMLTLGQDRIELSPRSRRPVVFERRSAERVFGQRMTENQPLNVRIEKRSVKEKPRHSGADQNVGGSTPLRFT